MRQSSVISFLWIMIFLLRQVDTDFGYLHIYLDMLGWHSVSASSLRNLTDQSTKLTQPNFPENYNHQKHCSDSLKCLCHCLFRGRGGMGRKWSWPNRGSKLCPVILGVRTEVRNGRFPACNAGSPSSVTCTKQLLYLSLRHFNESIRALPWDAVQQTSCNEVHSLFLRFFYSFCALLPVDTLNSKSYSGLWQDTLNGGSENHAISAYTGKCTRRTKSGHIPTFFIKSFQQALPGTFQRILNSANTAA